MRTQGKCSGKEREEACGVSGAEYTKSSLQVTKRGTVSIGQKVMGHELVMYPTDLTAGSCLRRNYGIIFTSDMG